MNDDDRFCFNCGTPYEAPSVQPIPVGPSIPVEDPVPVSVVEVVSPEVFVEEPQDNVPGPTMFLNEKDLRAEDEEEVTGELHPVVKARIYGVLKYMEEGSEKEFKMEDIVVVIGRDAATCDIVISIDRFVGRNHALIYTKDGKFYAVDLNSKNGTFVNGQQITGLNQLDRECVVKVANTEIRFQPA
jgi:hypothetical protein